MAAWAEDDDLMNELKAALAEAQAVSDRSRDAARAAFAWRTVDEELMMLAHDSSSMEVVLVRGSPTDRPRVISFVGQGFSLEIEIDDGQVLGQVTPGRLCQVSMSSPDGVSQTADTDEAGFFSMTDLGSGPVRFQVQAGATVQTTEWIVL